MTPLRFAPLATLLLGAPALAQVADEPPPADGEPEVRLWKEKCDLDGKGGGELLRVSGSSAAGNMSQGRETWRIHRGADVVVELLQEGRPQTGAGATIPEGDRWTVTCARGAIVARAGDAELKLAVGGKGASIDPALLRALSPEKGRELALGRLEGLSALLDGLADEPAVGGADEAAARVTLLIAERAIDAGDTDRAESALQLAEAGKLPALAAWAKKVAARLDAARGASPIRAVAAVQIGTVDRAVTVPVGRVGDGELGQAPDVFWSRDALCVRQGGEQAGTMRCWDVAAAKWREPAPYASPWGSGPTLKAQYLGSGGGYATRLALVEPSGERVLGELQSPSILARDVRGGLVVRAAGPGGKGAVTVLGYDATAGAGSVLAGGGRWFFDGPSALRPVAQVGRSWSVATPGKDAGVACVSEPLTSPDEKRAACLAAKGGESPPPGGLELWLFDLVEAPSGK